MTLLLITAKINNSKKKKKKLKAQPVFASNTKDIWHFPYIQRDTKQKEEEEKEEKKNRLILL